MLELPFRIVILDPPPGVVFRMQRGRSELVPPSAESASALTFDFTLRVADDARDNSSPRLLGPFAQGPPAARFVYVNSGKHAGQPDSCWDRRAKVHLREVTASLIAQAAASGAVIEARIAGTGRDSGPACATVPILGGWRLAR